LRVEHDDVLALVALQVDVPGAARVADQRDALAGQELGLVLERAEGLGALGALAQEGGGEERDPRGQDQREADGDEEPPPERPGAAGGRRRRQGATAL
jgi:hypothetical protein